MNAPAAPGADAPTTGAPASGAPQGGAGSPALMNTYARSELAFSRAQNNQH